MYNADVALQAAVTEMAPLLAGEWRSLQRNALHRNWHGYAPIALLPGPSCSARYGYRHDNTGPVAGGGPFASTPDSVPVLFNTVEY